MDLVGGICEYGWEVRRTGVNRSLGRYEIFMKEAIHRLHRFYLFISVICGLGLLKGRSAVIGL